MGYRRVTGRCVRGRFQTVAIHGGVWSPSRINPQRSSRRLPSARPHVTPLGTARGPRPSGVNGEGPEVGDQVLARRDDPPDGFQTRGPVTLFGTAEGTVLLAPVVGP